jgi:hypothetical protein
MNSGIRPHLKRCTADPRQGQPNIHWISASPQAAQGLCGRE